MKRVAVGDPCSMTELPTTPFLSSEIAAIGLSRKQLRALVEAGVVRRVLYGVYCRADLEDTSELRAACAARVLLPHVVVSDRSAAWLHQVECCDSFDPTLLPRLDVVSTNGHERTRRGELLGGKRDLRPEDICEISGVKVTTPLRTACDLGCLRGRNTALAALDGFRRVCDLTIADYLGMLPRYAGRRGVIQLRELIPYASDKAESAPESWTRMTVIDDGLPAPEPQIWVFIEGFGWVRVDLGYERLRIAIEYDGEEHHSSEEDRDADRVRRKALRDAGWIVIVVRKGDFSPTRRAAWLGEVRDGIESRRPVAQRVYSRGESRYAGRPRRRTRN